MGSQSSQHLILASEAGVPEVALETRVEPYSSDTSLIAECCCKQTLCKLKTLSQKIMLSSKKYKLPFKNIKEDVSFHCSAFT